MVETMTPHALAEWAARKMGLPFQSREWVLFPGEDIDTGEKLPPSPMPVKIMLSASGMLAFMEWLRPTHDVRIEALRHGYLVTIWKRDTDDDGVEEIGQPPLAVLRAAYEALEGRKVEVKG